MNITKVEHNTRNISFEFTAKYCVRVYVHTHHVHTYIGTYNIICSSAFVDAYARSQTPISIDSYVAINTTYCSILPSILWPHLPSVQFSLMWEWGRAISFVMVAGSTLQSQSALPLDWRGHYVECTT